MPKISTLRFVRRHTNYRADTALRLDGWVYSGCIAWRLVDIYKIEALTFVFVHDLLVFYALSVIYSHEIATLLSMYFYIFTFFGLLVYHPTSDLIQYWTLMKNS